MAFILASNIHMNHLAFLFNEECNHVGHFVHEMPYINYWSFICNSILFVFFQVQIIKFTELFPGDKIDTLPALHLLTTYALICHNELKKKNAQEIATLA